MLVILLPQDELLEWMSRYLDVSASWPSMNEVFLE
jgi:hypothetical protein